MAVYFVVVFEFSVSVIRLNVNSVRQRRPLDERLRERDLEAAITLSLLNNLNEAQDQTPISKGMALR